MKKRKLFNCIVALASVGFMVGCSASNLRSSGNGFNQYEISNHATDEAEAEELDFTGDIEISTEGAATKEEILELAYSLYSKPFIDYYVNQLPKLADFFFAHNTFTLNEVEVIVKIVLTDLPQLVKDPSASHDQGANIIIQLLTRVDIDKVIDMARGIIGDEEALNEIKNFAEISGTKATGIYANAAEALPEDEELQELARLEEVYRYNLRTLNAGGGLSLFDIIPDVVNDKDVVVMLRVISHMFKTLSAELDEYAFGYLLSSLFRMGDETYREMCARYTMAHLEKYLQDLGSALSKMNLTVGTWEGFLNGFAATVQYMNNNAAQTDNTFSVRENRIIGLFSEQVASVMEPITGSGFKVLIKFIAEFLAHVDQSIIDEITEHASDMSQFDPSKIIDIYNEVYGLLTESEKNDLDAQLSVFGIDIHNLNTDIGSLDPDSRSAIGPVIDLININITVPILAYFGDGFKTENPYEETGFEVRVSTQNATQLTFREGDTITEDDLISYITSEYSFEITFDGQPSSTSYHNTYKDKPEYRSNIVFSESTVDTSAAGNHGEIIFTLDTKFEYQDYETQEELLYEFQGVEIRWYYEVISNEIDFYGLGFSAELYDKTSGTVESYRKDSNGVKASQESNTIERSIYVVQDGDYAADELAIKVQYTLGYSYDKNMKRYTYAYGDTVYFNLSDLTRNELGEFWVADDYTIENATGGDSIAAKLVFKYKVVKGIQSTDMDGAYYDPGFIYGGN